ncbi:hypothetical protein [Paraburkholderia sp. SIMBA_054]|uniref:hypothetical protein n=1 Tax=Paraburkholderia sp. SIMBA_054 TaxID=3085795 RepID=UPI003977EBC7
MKLPFAPSEDVALVLRVVWTIVLAGISLVALAITVAMFWRDVGVASYFDHLFGTWSDGTLTCVTIVVDVLAIAAVRATQKSLASSRRKQSNN